MNITRKTKFKRGVALIFALFTIAVLFSIGTTVVALSLHDSRGTRTANYNEAALHAANWGIEAVINYMGQPGYKFTGQSRDFFKSQWEVTNKYTYGGGEYSYTTGRNLAEVSDGVGLNSSVEINVRTLKSNELAKDYGLDYSNGRTTLGEDKWNEKHDSRLVEFRQPSGSGISGDYRLNYGAKGDTYSTVKVVCTEFRYPNSNQPSQYQLLSVARVFARDDSVPDNKKVPLATRVVEARVRESVACDFMHFIQNARSWDATGVDLGRNSTMPGASIARDSVFLPENYFEAGRLRVDGYDSDKNPEKNDVKMYLNSLGVDGTLAFYSNTNVNNNRYIFQGDVTTMRSRDTFLRRNGSGTQVKKLDSVDGMFSGALRDGTKSLGLPQADSYFAYAKDRATTNQVTNKAECDFTIAGDNRASYGYNASDRATVLKNYGKNGVGVYKGKCPDIAQAETKVSDGFGGFEKIGAAVPTFATVRVEICGDSVRIVKYNSAITSGDGTVGSNYIENLTPGGRRSTKISNIKNGVINVTGGNVEVVHVKKFTDKGNNSFSTDYIDASSKGVKNNADSCLDGALTIVSNVNEARDISLNNVGATSKQYGNSALYSDDARKLYQENPYVNVPPFSEKRLYGKGSSVKSIWPTPANSAIEREGNIVLGSDIAYKSQGNTSSSLGIVAKNYVLLNDKAAYTKQSNKDRKNKLRIDAVLMSMDHSVQFDWNNLGANSSDAFDLLKLTRKKNGGQDREFTLNGAIVGGFLDVEGDTAGRGYYNQNFHHDENLRYNLPPVFPRWDLGDFADSGVFGDWMITAYEDKGAISDL